MSKRKQKDSARPGARRPAPVRRSTDIPVLPAVVAVLLVVVAAALVVIYITSKPQTAQAISGITCDTQEHVDSTSVHYHAHLTILYQGTDVTIPAQIGIPDQGNCIYWMHTHDTTGVIHVEAPKAKAKDFTLGEFFAIWQKPLSPTKVAYFTIGSSQKLVTYVDGKQEPDGFDPSTIKITAHAQIVLEITPPVVDPPPSYTFPQGL